MIQATFEDNAAGLVLSAQILRRADRQWYAPTGTPPVAAWSAGQPSPAPVQLAPVATTSAGSFLYWFDLDATGWPDGPYLAIVGQVVGGTFVKRGCIPINLIAGSDRPPVPRSLTPPVGNWTVGY